MNETNYRSIDITGLVPFARGGTAECFRLDEDKILKLYFDESKKNLIQKEKTNAVEIIRSDLPTALSYEIVTCGDRVGIIYEMIDAVDISATIRKDSSQAGPLGTEFAKLAKDIHSHTDSGDRFRQATFFMRSTAENLPYVSCKAKTVILSLLDELDTYHSFLHGDFHPGNALVTKDGLYLIDLVGFSNGCPALDVATLLFSFYAAPAADENGMNTFNGLTKKQMDDFWTAFRKEYFGPENSRIWELLPTVLLLKRMNFEQFAGYKCSDEYRKAVREDVISVFENGQPYPALPC
ncbi:MAG: phosphotransferase [Spirochaetales bacterium]|nr:phosphotransferase [Spirochaetales bacterium]